MADTQILNEITDLRTERNKTFDLDNGKQRLVCHCKPIHYRNGRGWENIDIDFRDDGDKFLTDQNKVSVGFRKDKKLHKHFGLRYDYDHQFEGGYISIKLDGKEQVTSDKVISIVKESKNEIKHQLNSEVELTSYVNEVGIKNFVKVDSPIEGFKIVEELHLKGLTCSNKKNSNKYIPDKYGLFNFVDEKGEKKFWINPPFFEDVEKETSRNLAHTLEEIDGKLIYTKTPTKQGQDDLTLAQYPILIDTNTYYSSTADGRVTYYVSESGVWDTVRIAGTGTNMQSDQVSSTVAMEGCSNVSGKGDVKIIRSFFYFDTSDLGGNTVTSAVLSLYCAGTPDSDVSAQKGIQADILATADYDSFVGTTGDNDPDGREYGHVSWVTDQYNSITFNATGKSDINLTGTTKICCREYSHDYLDSEPSSAQISNGCYYADDTSDPTKDPKLEIDYTTGGGDTFKIPEFQAIII